MSFKIDESQLVCSAENRILEDIFDGVCIAPEDAIALANEIKNESKPCLELGTSAYSTAATEARKQKNGPSGVKTSGFGLFRGGLGGYGMVDIGNLPSAKYKGDFGAADIDPRIHVGDPSALFNIDPGIYVGDPSALFNIDPDMHVPLSLGVDTAFLDMLGQAEKAGESVDDGLKAMRDAILLASSRMEKPVLLETDSTRVTLEDYGAFCFGIGIEFK